jgi:hypothetical protein
LAVRQALARWIDRVRTRKAPDLRSLGRTGDARYVPQMTRWGQKGQAVVCLANRFDDVSIRDYDRVRMYPVVRDALSTIVSPIKRANFHFSCSDQAIADLAMQEVGPHIGYLVGQLIRGGAEFGRQSMEIVWRPSFDVEVPGGQASSEQPTLRYPLVWSIDGFKAFSPQDTAVLIGIRTGRFGGIRQFLPVRHQDVPARKLVHFVHDQEFDSNYGIPRTKSCVPFVEIAESVWDDMALYSKLFAVPIKKGRHRPGHTPTGEGGQIDNAQMMVDLASSIDSGQSVSLPAEYDKNGNLLWDFEFVQPPGEDRYVDKLRFLHETIRISLVVPEMASSSAPDTGTYNLGETQIDLFLTNIESYLDELATTINDQLMRQFVDYNFGAQAPDCKLVFEPLDIKVKHALLKALLGMLGSGLPVEDADGQQYEADWPKLAEDAGIALRVRTLRQQAAGMQRAIIERLGTPGGAEDPQAGSGKNRGPNGEFAPKLADRDWREEDHPRDQDGKFARKDAGEAEGVAKEEDILAHVEQAIANPGFNERLLIGTVQGTFAKQVREAGGPDVSGYHFVLDQADVRHAMASHGDPQREAPRGLTPITETDFGLLPRVIQDPDRVTCEGKTKQGLDVLRIEKRIATTLFVSFVVRTGRKQLACQSMWRSKK